LRNVVTDDNENMEATPYDELRDTMKYLGEDHDEMAAENKTTNATLAKVDDSDDKLDKEFDGTFPISQASLAKIDEEGASDNDM
jgi:hypothetical protein